MKRILSALGILLTLAGIPTALYLTGIDPRNTDWSWQLILRRDDGTVLLQVIVTLAWVLWAAFAYSFLGEFLRLFTRVRIPRVPLASAGAAVLITGLMAVTPAASAEALTSASAPQSLSALTTVEEPSLFIVQKGDTLSGIAQEKLGDANQWPELWDANKDQITDPNLIYPEQELQLTPAPEATSDTTPAPEATSDTTPAPEATSDTTPAPEATSDTTPAPILWSAAGIGTLLAAGIVRLRRARRRQLVDALPPGVVVLADETSPDIPWDDLGEQIARNAKCFVAAQALRARAILLMADAAVFILVEAPPANLLSFQTAELELTVPYEDLAHESATNNAPFITLGRAGEHEIVMLNLQELGQMQVSGADAAGFMRAACVELALSGNERLSVFTNLVDVPEIPTGILAHGTIQECPLSPDTVVIWGSELGADELSRLAQHKVLILSPDPAAWTLDVQSEVQATLEPLGKQVEPQFLSAELAAETLPRVQVAPVEDFTPPAAQPAPPPQPAEPVTEAEPAELQPVLSVLGTVSLTAPGPEPRSTTDRGVTSHIPVTTALAAFLAFSPPATSDTIATHVWNGRRITPATLHSATSRLDKWLGKDQHGDSRLTTKPKYELRIATDWSNALNHLGADPNNATTAQLVNFLLAITGEPFDVPERQQRYYTWAEPWIAEIRNSVEWALHRLTETVAEHPDQRDSALQATQHITNVWPTNQSAWHHHLTLNNVRDERERLYEALENVDLGPDLKDLLEAS